jgi:hypothetical protein
MACTRPFCSQFIIQAPEMSGCVNALPKRLAPTEIRRLEELNARDEAQLLQMFD